jgi:hypothetical protein
MPTSTDTGSLVSNNQSHHYCSLKPLDATNLENDYPTSHVSFSATFGKERVNDNWAMCFLHTISNANTSAALEAHPNTVPSCIGHRRGNRTFGFENASFLIKCLALGVDGYSAGWLQVKFCTKCMFHSCCWFYPCQMQETRSLLLHGSHFQIWRNLAPAATTNTMQFVWKHPFQSFPFDRFKCEGLSTPHLLRVSLWMCEVVLWTFCRRHTVRRNIGKETRNFSHVTNAKCGCRMITIMIMIMMMMIIIIIRYWF